MNQTLKTTQEQKQVQKLSQAQLQQLDILELSSDELKERLELELEENPLLERTESRGRSYGGGFNADFYQKAGTKSLKEWLGEQVLLTVENSSHAGIMNHVIQYVQDSGYLGDISEDPFLSELPAELFEEILFKLQALEPPGVFARNLSECLALQVKRRGWDMDLISLLIEEDLESIAMGRYDDLMKKYQVSEWELKDEIKKLHTLDPKPGLQYAESSESDYVVADIILTQAEEGFVISLNEQSYPVLNIIDLYDSVTDEKTLEYIHEKKSRARFIMDALVRRRETILLVMKEVLNHHQGFFERGVPMEFLTRQMIADRVELHNSTVSRAVKNKYLLFKNKIYPLESFFPKGVQTTEGTKISSDMVKSIIGRMIDSENKKKPLSDQKISDMLEDMGILIARRTVTKYREELEILHSSYRRV